MAPERQWKGEFEKDKAKLTELNKQYENHETILLEKLYHSKKRFEKISDEKHASLVRWKNLINPHDILRDVGIESRLEFLRTSKAHEYPVIQHRSDHRIISRGQSGLNIDFGAPGMGIVASSPHGGNVRADAVLLIINSSHRAKFEQTFQEIYGISLDDVKQGCADKFAPQLKVTEMVNLRGTMAHLGCFTKHPPDKDADDRFLTLSEYCESEYECAIRRSSTNLQAAKAFNSAMIRELYWSLQYYA